MPKRITEGKVSSIIARGAILVIKYKKLLYKKYIDVHNRYNQMLNDG